MNYQTPDEQQTSELLRILAHDQSQRSARKAAIREQVLTHFDELAELRASQESSPSYGDVSDDLIIDLRPQETEGSSEQQSGGHRWLATAAAIAAIVAGAWLVLGLFTDDGRPVEIGVVDEAEEAESPDPENSDVITSSAPASSNSVVLPAGTNALPSLGGMQFELATASKTLVSEQCVFIFGSDPAGAGSPAPFVFIGQIDFTNTTANGLAPISSVSEWIEFVEAGLGITPQELDETIELFGQTLSGFAVDVGGTIPNTLHQFNCAQDAVTASDTGYVPVGIEEWFVAENDGGLLVVASAGATIESAENMRNLRGEILPTITRVEAPGEFSHAPVVEPGAAPVPLELPTPSIAGRSRTVTFPAMGGIRFDVDEAHSVQVIGDRIVIDPTGSGGAFIADVAHIGITTQSADGSAITTTEDFLAEFESFPQLGVEPNGQVVELFGRELTGYTVALQQPLPFPFTGSSPNPDLALFATTRQGASFLSAWAPQRTQLFLADTPAGVLYAGFDVNPYAAEPPARAAFATLLATAELTASGLDAPLPTGATFGGGATRPEAAAISDDGPPGYFGQFANSVPPGRFQLQNFGAPISADITGWGISQNQPGILRFVGRSGTTRAPGQASVVLVADVQPTLTPQAGGPTLVGDPIDLSTIESFLDAPPSNLAVTNVSQTEVGGLSAIRFDVRVNGGQSCAQDEPCEYAFQTAWDLDFPISISAEAAQRIWWIPDHPAGPSMIIISDPDPNFLDIGTTLVDSIEAVG